VTGACCLMAGGVEAALRARLGEAVAAYSCLGRRVVAFLIRLGLCLSLGGYLYVPFLLPVGGL